MYEELVESLRLCVKYGKAQDALENAEQAADAIDELSRENESLAKSVNEASEILRRRWIPLTKCLPEAYEDVLLLFSNNQAAGFCDRDGCWGVYSGNGFYTEVAENETKPTHWAKKLPDPPKEG
jgi:hypothetical protein